MSVANRRRWLRRVILAIVMVVGLPFLVIGFGLWQDGYAWRAACAEADRLDPGWRLEERLASRPAMPDAENAALTVQAAGRLLPKVWPMWTTVIHDDEIPPPPPDAPPDSDDRTASETLEQRRFSYAHDVQSELSNAPGNRRLRPAVLTIVQRMADSVAPAVEAARPLVHQPRGHSPLLPGLKYDNNFHEAVRKVTALLEIESKLQAERNDIAGALASCRAMLNATATIADDPSLIGPITAMSCRTAALYQVQRTLGHGEPSLTALADLQRQLEEMQEQPILLAALRGDRVDFVDSVRELDEGRLPLDVMAVRLQIDIRPEEVTGYETIDAWWHRLRGKGWRRSYAAAGLHYVTQMIEITKPSPDELFRRSADVDAARAALPSAMAKTGEYVDALINFERQARALLRATIAALAAERFRQERGRWPESLNEMTPHYLQAIATDPYDGQPLRLRSLPDGLVIYSVGKNGTDDGGQVVRDAQTLQLLDIGFRLWDVPQRRQPPGDDPKE